MAIIDNTTQVKLKYGPQSDITDNSLPIDDGSIIVTDAGNAYIDNTTRIQIKDSTKVPIDGGTMTGPLTTSKVTGIVTSSITNDTDATNKEYVEALYDNLEQEIVNTAAQYLPLKGGTMAGVLDMGNNYIQNLEEPQNADEATNKGYVDSNFLKLTGGTLTGTLRISTPGGVRVSNDVNTADNGLAFNLDSDNSTVLMGPFANQWHPITTYLTNDDIIDQEIKTTTADWAAATDDNLLDLRPLFAMRNNSVSNILNSTIIGRRFTLKINSNRVNPISNSSIRYFQVTAGYVNNSYNVKVTIESKVNDEDEWGPENIVTIAGQYGTSSFWIPVPNISAIVRFTFEWVDTLSANFRLNNLLGWSYREGEQGAGWYNRMPFTWNEDRDITLYRNLYPRSNNGGSLGNSMYRFNNAYLSGLNVNGTSYTATILPQSNSNDNVGSSTAKYGAMYANNFIGDNVTLANNLTVTNIGTFGTAGTTNQITLSPTSGITINGADTNSSDIISRFQWNGVSIENATNNVTTKLNSNQISIVNSESSTGTTITTGYVASPQFNGKLQNALTIGSKTYDNRTAQTITFADFDVEATATTGAAGSNASVTVEGNTFNFTIPKGDTGAQGPQGPIGETGPQGPIGNTGPAGTDGEDGGYWTPSIDTSGNLTWTASKSGMGSVASANIRGPQGIQGPAGTDGQDGLTTAIKFGNHSTNYTQSNGVITIPAADILTSAGVTATATELNWVDGVTSNIQTQLNNKFSVNGGVINGDIVSDENNSRNLGASNNKWANVYATTFTGNLTGNATSASKLATARTITLAGNATGSASFDGSANITINTTVTQATTAVNIDDGVFS